MKRRLVLVALAALALVPHAFAGEGPPERRGEHMRHMQEQFGITDEQMEQMREIRRNGGSREDAHAVLTEEQRTAMREWHEQHPGGGRGKGSREERAEHRARMQEQFGITDEQMQQMRAIRHNGGSREEAEAVLNDEQRAAIGAWREQHPPPGRGQPGRGVSAGDES